MSTEFHNNLPENYRPIGAWGYLGYQLLFSIPCVGLILMLVFSFRGTGNINLRNFARYNLLVIAIVLVIYLILFILIMVGGISLADYASTAGYY